MTTIDLILTILLLVFVALAVGMWGFMAIILYHWEREIKERYAEVRKSMEEDKG